MKAFQKLLSTSLLFLSLMITSSSLLAAENNISKPIVEPEAFIRMFIGLIVVIGLIFLVAWLSRKMKLMQSFSSGYQIKNLATLSLTTREKVSLIEIAGKQILIGVSPGRVNQLHVFDEPLEVSENSESAATNNVFSKYFKNALNVSNSAENKK